MLFGLRNNCGFIGLSLLFILSSLVAGVMGSHTNNWAVLVSTSRFWFNYRHMANVLSMYRTVKRLGIPDSQIILMLSDDVACNSRNLFPGSVFNNKDHAIDLYGESVEVDYRGYEVTVENFIRLLTDRWSEDQPKSKRLLTDENSNIFIYMTGHGGDDFLKFQDAEEIASEDIADAFAQMYEKKRYNEILFMIDTCQANTMFSKFYSPNILAVGSSELDESSYSHHSDVEIGVAVIDRFTYYTLEYLEQIEKNSTLTLQDLFDSYTFEKVHSHTGVRTDSFQRDIKDVLITDFFGNVQNIIPESQVTGTSSSSEIDEELDNDIKALVQLAVDKKIQNIVNNTLKKESIAQEQTNQTAFKTVTADNINKLDNLKSSDNTDSSSSKWGHILVGISCTVMFIILNTMSKKLESRTA